MRWSQCGFTSVIVTEYGVAHPIAMFEGADMRQRAQVVQRFYVRMDGVRDWVLDVYMQRNASEFRLTKPELIPSELMIGIDALAQRLKGVA